MGEIDSEALGKSKGKAREPRSRNDSAAVGPTMAIGSRNPGAEAHAGSDSMIGRVLGRNYRVVERLGVGGMGVVYVVEHTQLRKRFAAKVLAADLARQPEAIARFEVEAHSASQLDHENIVSVNDYGVDDDGTVFLIMELLRGETLAQRSMRGRLSLEEIVAVIVPVCRALATAHAAGIVHRDMKPDNVFLTERGLTRPVVKVLDFGISKARQGSLRDGRITRQGQVLGSPEYMSPEAARGEEVDSRADVYAVGVMLYELACDQVPFRSENYLKVLQMHVSEHPVAPRELRPELPVALENVILGAMRKDPDERFGSVEELEVELLSAVPEAAERGLHSGHTPLPRTSGVMAAVTVPTPTLPAPSLPGQTLPGETATILRPSRRGRWIALAALAIVAAIAIPVIAMRGDPALSARAPAPATPVAVNEIEAAVPATPAPIRFLVASQPAGATVRVGDRTVGTTPIDLTVASAPGQGSVTIELAGYQPEVRTVSLDRDVQLELALERNEATAPAPAPAPPRTRPHAPRTRPSRPAARPRATPDLDIKTDR